MDQFLLQRERGQTVLSHATIIQPSRLKVAPIQKTKTLHLGQFPLAFLTGIDDCLAFITADQSAYFSTLGAPPLTLSRAQEVTLKLLLSSTSLLQVTVIRTSKQIKLYRYSLSLLLAGHAVREQILDGEVFSITEFVHIDTMTEHLAIHRQGNLEVWDTNTQQILYTRPCHKVWYSCGFAVVAEEPVLYIVDIATLQTSSVFLGEDCIVSHAEVAGKFLVFVADSFYAVNLQTLEPIEFPAVIPKLCLQSELLEDMLIVTENSGSFFLSQPLKEIAFDCEAPLFTSVYSELAVFETATLSFIEKRGDRVNSIQLPEDEVSCIGANSTTNEVLLGTTTGSVYIVY